MNVDSSFIHNVPKLKTPKCPAVGEWIANFGIFKVSQRSKLPTHTMFGNIKSIMWWTTGNRILHAVWIIWHTILEKITLYWDKRSWWLARAGDGARCLTSNAQEGSWQGTGNILNIDSGGGYTRFNLSKLIKLYT